MHFQKKVRPAGALLFDAMFHIESGCGFMRFSDGLGGDSGYTGVWRHIVENNTTGTNFGSDSDLDVAVVAVLYIVLVGETLSQDKCWKPHSTCVVVRDSSGFSAVHVYKVERLDQDPSW